MLQTEYPAAALHNCRFNLSRKVSNFTLFFFLTKHVVLLLEVVHHILRLLHIVPVMYPRLWVTSLSSDSETSVGLRKTYYISIIHHLLPLTETKKETLKVRFLLKGFSWEHVTPHEPERLESVLYTCNRHWINTDKNL